MLAHPAGSDLRTPLEIWTALLYPLVSKEGQDNVTTYAVTDSGASRTFTPIGQIARSALRQLDYARFLDVADGSTAPIMTLVSQT